MTTYGDTARVSVDVEGGGIAGITVGTAQKLVVFARGNTDSGTAQTNTPTDVSGPSDAEAKFGADSELTAAITDAAANGAGYDYITGVMPATQAITGEAHGATQSFTLANSPLIEDASTITITDTQAGVDLDVTWDYASPPTTPSAEDTATVNPFTGEIEADAASGYEVDYKTLQWQAAFEAATGVIQEQETGVWRVHSEAESVVSDAIATATPLRESEWKMVRVQAAAQPNANTDTSPANASINPTTYTDSLDDDALFLTGPERRPGSDSLVGGAVAGLFAGHSLTDPVLGDSLTGVTDLEQTLTVPEQESLEAAGVIPIAASGSPSLESNVSTATATDWTRDYFTRRVVDQVILTARAVAKSVRGRLNSDQTELLTEETITDELEELVDQGVLRPNTETETRYYVSANQDPTNPRELDVSLGVTPTGVVDTVDVDLTVNV